MRTSNSILGRDFQKKRLLQVFYMDVEKVDQDIAYVASV
jgi:hypothetical protein